jgi:hypothetical protein
LGRVAPQLHHAGIARTCLVAVRHDPSVWPFDRPRDRSAATRQACLVDARLPARQFPVGGR